MHSGLAFSFEFKLELEFLLAEPFPESHSEPAEYQATMHIFPHHTAVTMLLNGSTTDSTTTWLRRNRSRGDSRGVFEASASVITRVGFRRGSREHGAYERIEQHRHDRGRQGSGHRYWNGGHRDPRAAAFGSTSRAGHHAVYGSAVAHLHSFSSFGENGPSSTIPEQRRGAAQHQRQEWQNA